jgi:poly-gamma-glutamate synthesis protein (capsule biosynthesis protein)
MSVRLLFVGDICGEDGGPASHSLAEAFGRADFVIANLEGAVLTDECAAQAPRAVSRPYYNAPGVGELLRATRVSHVTLANNHTGDFEVPIDRTCRFLSDQSIVGFGAGLLDAAAAPAVITAGADQLVLACFGWSVIGCRPATATHEGSNPMTRAHTRATAKRLRRLYPKAAIIFLMHWNYELELYPQPADRELARELFADGVDLIVGAHAHRAQGVEVLDGKVVAYGLGNWWFPPRESKSLPVAFPVCCERQLALEVEFSGRAVESVVLHWHRFDAVNKRILFNLSEGIDGEVNRSLVPFAGAKARDYQEWFRRNRARRRLLPVYGNYRSRTKTVLLDQYMKMRTALIDMLVRAGLKAPVPSRT